MNRFWLFILFITPTVFCSKLEERITSLEQEMKQVQPPTRSIATHCEGTSSTFSVLGALLMWNIKEGGKEHISKLWSKENALGETSLGWGVGFRVAALLDLTRIDRKVFASFTSFRVIEKDHTLKEAQGLILNVKGKPYEPLNQPNVRDSFSYENIDAGLKKSLFGSSFLSFHTVLGGKVSWFNQHRSVKYVVSQGGKELTAQAKERFHGVGPLFGFDMAWYLYRSLHLSTHLSGALQYGDFKSKYWERIGDVEVGITDTPSFLLPSARSVLGIGWQGNWRSVFLQADVGYEVEYFFRSRQVLILGSDSMGRFLLRKNARDLVLYGVTVRLSLGF